MCEHAVLFAEKHTKCQIIETGSAWDKDNWEGQGQSTLIWNWLLDKTACEPYFMRALSIDITPTSTENAKQQAKRVDFVCADSVKTLNNLHTTHPDALPFCGLLYLDSYDWSEEMNLESSFHHMAELATCWESLPSGCMIVVDDRHGEMAGKHWLVDAFMKKLGITPVFKNHQIGWIKP